jgi:hypothetical protein
VAKESLEQKVQRLEREVERSRAATECSRLLGRFCYLNNPHIQNKEGTIADLFALKTPGVRVQWGQVGVFEGAKSILKIYGPKTAVSEMGPQSRAGWMFIHPLASPYIEVAGDLKTAKGVWLSIGIESAADKEGKLTPAWGWGAYGVDFVKEDGQWKIWHFHIYRIFRAPYKESWTAWNADAEEGMPADVMKADRPGKDDYPYRPNKPFIFKPDPPTPYETFDESTAY